MAFIYPSEELSSGCWRVINDHIVASVEVEDCRDINDSNADARVIVKPGVSRSGIVVDLANGAGIGIGLEQKAILEEEVRGTYETFTTFADEEGGSEEIFYRVVVSLVDENFVYQATPYDSNTFTLDNAHTIEGEIAINQMCDGTPIDGVMCVTLPGGMKTLGFMDPEDGYFMLMGPGVLMVGVKGDS